MQKKFLSHSLFAFFRDADGTPRTPRGKDGMPPMNRELLVRQWSEDTIRQVGQDSEPLAVGSHQQRKKLAF